MHRLDSIPTECRRAVAFIAARATGEPVDRSLRITVNFQPDRRVSGVWILERLAEEGLYRSQFETGHSSGGVPIDPECPERWQFEHDNFGGSYDEAAPEIRPKYGALNFLRDDRGAAPWYGSAHIRLAEHVLDRATFCFPDSAAPPSRFGTATACELIPLAQADLDTGIDPIKIYIEAHIHGPLTLADVETIVLDPSFQGTLVHDQARLLDAPIEWHSGFRVATRIIHADPGFRGQDIADLACSLARNGYLTPACLSPAAEAGTDPRALRRVWHCLAHFGATQREATPPTVSY